MKKLISKFWFQAAEITLVIFAIALVSPKNLEMQEISTVNNKNLYKMVDKETPLFVSYVDEIENKPIKEIIVEEIVVEEEIITPTQENNEIIEEVEGTEKIEEPIIEEIIVPDVTLPLVATAPIIDSFDARLSAYGPDCSGCRGITNSGYDVRETIYYDDTTYGNLRIIAADYNVLPMGSIVKITNFKFSDEPIYAIVLDKGSRITGNRIDLLYESETLEIVYNIGITDVKCEVIRKGY